MTYEKIDFNTAFIESFNTCEEFINHVSNGHLWPGDEQRKKKLTELYFLVNPKKKQAVKQYKMKTEVNKAPKDTTADDEGVDRI
jgi:hypothetical protein